MNQNTTPQEPAGQVEIPPTAVVNCPLVGFKLRQVSKCMSCQHFAGALQDRFPGADHMAFTQRYCVPCSARPTLREMKEIEA